LPSPPLPSPPPPGFPIELEEEEEEEEAEEIVIAGAAPFPPGVIFGIIGALVALLGPCAICGCVLFKVFVVPILKKKLADAKAAGAAKSDQEAEEEEDKDDEKEAPPAEDPLVHFLDNTYVTGMDDAAELEINPVMKYRVDEEKRAAVRAAADAAGESTQGGGSNPMMGVPGAIARLGWSLNRKDVTGDDKKQQDIKRNKKSIESYLARNWEGMDVSYQIGSKKTAGGGMANALAMAQETAVKRVGGRRSSTLIMTAQKGRAQLAAALEQKPNAFGVQGKAAPTTGRGD